MLENRVLIQNVLSSDNLTKPNCISMDKHSEPPTCGDDDDKQTRNEQRLPPKARDCWNKKGKLRFGLSDLLALLKQQVMLDIGSKSSRLISMEMPTSTLPFLNCLADVFVVTYLDAFPLFQINSPSIALQNKPAYKKLW